MHVCINQSDLYASSAVYVFLDGDIFGNKATAMIPVVVSFLISFKALSIDNLKISGMDDTFSFLFLPSIKKIGWIRFSGDNFVSLTSLLMLSVLLSRLILKDGNDCLDNFFIRLFILREDDILIYQVLTYEVD